MCLPSADTAIAQLIQVVTEVKAKSVFLGRDSSDYDDRIKEALHQIGVSDEIRYSPQHQVPFLTSIA